jgi:hypothetical protein
LTHRAAPDFWSAYDALPVQIQNLAQPRFRPPEIGPHHPSLHFKKTGRFWSVRIGLHYRALATEMDDGWLWFWIGAHAAYDALVR